MTASVPRIFEIYNHELNKEIWHI